MSEATWDEGGGGSPIAVLAGFFVVALLLMLLASSVLVNSHAVIKHGDEALKIRSCLEKGEYQVWKSLTDPNKFFRICELEPGLFGLQVVQCLLSGTCEKTAFIKGDGSWGALMKYLGRMATRFNGTIP